MKKQLPPKRTSTNYVPVLMGIFVLVLAALLYNRYQDQVFSRLYRLPFMHSPKPTPTPTPIQLIQGKETYSVSQGKHAGPNISQVVFDPLDVKKGETLNITITVDDPECQTVTAVLQTDKQPQQITFQKSDTSPNTSIWQGSVIPESTLWYRYILTITAQSASGKSTATVAPRS